MAPDPHPELGLTDAQARERLARDGPNRMPRGPRRTFWGVAVGALTQPMFLLLLAAASVYALVGNMLDALTLLASVVLVATISIYQELRTERVLEALKDLASPRSRVLREGRVLHIASQDLVRGDRLLVAEGDRLACDARLVEAQALALDESLLTGESVPVSKVAAPAGAPVADVAAAVASDAAGDAAAAAQHLLYAGTLVVAGDGVAVVTATGAATALGRIGGSLSAVVPRPSRVQTELKQIVRKVALVAALTCVAAAAIYAARQGSWVQGLLVGLTLAMSVIPEEFAVVWTVMMALGAWRLSRHQVLTRQPQAIEALGTTSVLCVDKTGTLTHNRMELLALATPQAQARLAPGGVADARFATLLDRAARASVADGLEPMDRAILRLHERSLPTSVPLSGGLLLRQGVAPERPYVVHAWHGDPSPGCLAVKGAPEAVAALCGAVGAEEAAGRAEAATRLAAQGLRVLAVAQAPWDAGRPFPQPLPALEWLGLIGFLDPLRDDVPGAVATCRRAGMRVVMITGDAPATAAAIAGMAGLDAGRIVTGAELAGMDDATLDAASGSVSVFARVTPQQKLGIVRSLQRRGAVVAMTGDGVNDAIALRAADIGVAMGRRGTDVAREAAALVLLDDSFAALVRAVRLGRRIFVNLRHSVNYLLAVHVPIVAVSLIPVLFHGPVLLLPLHVVFLELIIDPACSLVFEAEAESAELMAQPPRPARVRLVSLRGAMRALGVGAMASLGVGAVQVLGHFLDWTDPWMRFAAFSSLIVANLAMLGWFLGVAKASAPKPENRVLLWLLLGICLGYSAVLMVAPLARQFGLPQGPGVQAAVAAMLCAAMLAAYRLHRASAEAVAEPAP